MFLIICLFISTIKHKHKKLKTPVTINGDQGYYTAGNKIYSNGKEVMMSGVNWFGFETDTFCPHGLWARNYKDMMNQIKNSGFNSIRLPFSNEMFLKGKTSKGIDFNMNPELKGLNPLSIMDLIMNYAQKIGLKIILDRHRPDSKGQSSLWYSQSCSETQWVADLVMLAKRYKGNQALIGFDLHNEPHDDACWGCNNKYKDWKMAATLAGNAILKANPGILIVVEGIQVYQGNWYWWGGNLMGVKDSKIILDVPNKVVYSTHDYPNSVSWQAYFDQSNYPKNLDSIWDKFWGYIVKDKIAPVLIGEFGSKLIDSKDKAWFNTLINYIKVNKLSYTFWSWNPNSGDTNGLLKDDWKTIDSNKLAALKSIQYPLI